MTGRVEGKVAFITGAARGQGRSHAIRLAEEGADIIAVDICEPIRSIGYPAATPSDLAETVRAVRRLGRRILASRVDIRDAAALRATVDAGVAELGRLDIVVANAGICVFRPWDEVTPQMWQDVIDVNLTGTWHTVRVSVPHLIAAGGGSIILISSTAGLKGLPFLTPYVASKHAVTGLARSFAHELARHHIRVNSVHPCAVSTLMNQDPDLDIDAVIAGNPRVGGMLVNSMPVEHIDPVEVSNAVLHLAGDESRYSTALAMTVDAGNTQY